MKTKLLTLAGLIIAAIGVSLVFGSMPVLAKGEKYEWIDKDTIKASGGLYENVNAANDGVINFPRKGNVFEIFSDGSCDITMTISVSIDNKNGTLVTEGCEDAAKDFDRSFTIANPEKGPPLDGSDIDYSNANCSVLYEGGLNVARCEAVKKCIADGSGTKQECLQAWASCMVENADQGNASYATCQEKIGGGDLSDGAAPEEEEGEKTTCVVDGIGWIVCPVVNFLSKIVDAAYGFVASLLVVQPLLTTGESKGIYDAWSVMRSFANVAFVIAFLIIIFSQLTSVGITNYGIKKLLPRLIMAAILVNISFWICAIAVDISNILGSSVNGLFESIGAQLNLPKGGSFGGGGGWTVLSGGILAGTLIAGAAAALYIGLSALIPALLVALLAIVTVFIVLTLRQALIILLIIIAPLAFVAYLLPNTESWFNKWKGLFQTLLLMYPIIAAIFGASALASQIIMGTASGTYKIAIQIMGALIAIAPLALTPIIMKTAGGVLGRIGAVVNNPNRGPFDRLRKKGEAYRGRRQNIMQARRLGGESAFTGARNRIRGDGSSRFRRAAAGTIGLGESFASNRAVASLTREQKNANAEKALGKAKQDYAADRIAEEAAAGSSEYAEKIAGPTGDVARIQAAAIAAKKNETAEAIKNAQISANIPPGNLAEMSRRLQEALRGGDDVTARAMQNMLLKSGSKGLTEYREVMNQVTSGPDAVDMNSGAGKAIRENMLENHGGIKANANDLMQQAITGRSMADVSSDQSTWKMPDLELAQQKPASINLALDSGAVSQEQAVRISSNEELAKYLDAPTRQRMEDLATRPAPPTPTPPSPPPPPSP